MATSIVTPKIELPNVTPVKQPIKVIKASPTKKIAAAMVVKVEPEQEPNKPAEKETAESKSPQVLCNIPICVYFRQKKDNMLTCRTRIFGSKTRKLCRVDVFV